MGGLGYNSTKKTKPINFNFTPSPKSEKMIFEEQQFYYLHEIKTNENTYLEEIFPKEIIKTDSDSKPLKIDFVSNYKNDKLYSLSKNKNKNKNLNLKEYDNYNDNEMKVFNDNYNKFVSDKYLNGKISNKNCNYIN
jgi:hypothetical protein